MYMSRMIEIGKAENGFVISCNVPLKPDAKKSNKMESCCMPGSCDKQYIAKDATEVTQLVSDLMPLLDGEYKTEDEFDAAFDESAKGMMSEMEGKHGEE